MTGLATTLDARDRQEAARTCARARPPLTDAQVARVADRIGVSMQDDGRLVVPDTIAPVRQLNDLDELAEAVLAAEAAPARHHEGDLIADHAKAGRDGMRKTALCGTGEVGADRRKALGALMITERVTSRREGTGRGRGERFWLSEFSFNI